MGELSGLPGDCYRNLAKKYLPKARRLPPRERRVFLVKLARRGNRFERLVCRTRCRRSKAAARLATPGVCEFVQRRAAAGNCGPHPEPTVSGYTQRKFTRRGGSRELSG
jgi:hypothetical protein